MADQKKNEHLNYAILEYLQQLIEKEGEEDAKDQLTAASECLERAFGLKTTSFGDSSKYSLYPTNLGEVFENGVGEEGDEAFKAKFGTYISKLEAKKYFDVGPEEQKHRFEKAKLKFKENYAKMNKKQEKGEEKEEKEEKKEKKIPTEEEKTQAAALKNQVCFLFSFFSFFSFFFLFFSLFFSFFSLFFFFLFSLFSLFSLFFSFLLPPFC